MPASSYLPVLCLLCLHGAPPAHAGPWPREGGANFVALSTGRQDVSLWVEHGLGEGRWLSADLRRDLDGTVSGGLIYSQAIPLPKAAPAGMVMALHSRGDLVRLPEGLVSYSGRISLGLGYGFSGRVNGWATLEGGYEERLPAPRWLADWVVGWQVTPKVAGLLQGEMRWPGDSHATRKLGAGGVLSLRRGLRISGTYWLDQTSGGREFRLGSWLDF